ncbi:MAG: oxygenase MpaB family protein, partial [Acidimicrobiales bacterium]
MSVPRMYRRMSVEAYRSTRRSGGASPGDVSPKRTALRVGGGSLPLGFDSITARVMQHPLVYFGGPRALLMELADPLVAAGVADHSNFEDRPFARLARTMHMMDSIAFGSPGKSEAATRAFAFQHERITGTAPDGRSYSGNDPELLLWVHATLVDTVLAMEKRYLGLLRDKEREDYYQESVLVALALGIPEKLVPADLGSFHDYVSKRVESLEVGEQARGMVRFILRPPVEKAVKPIAGLTSSGLGILLESVTAELLPLRLRREYGLDTVTLALTGAGLEVTSALTRTLAPRLPPVALSILSRLAGDLVGLDRHIA